MPLWCGSYIVSTSANSDIASMGVRCNRQDYFHAHAVLTFTRITERNKKGMPRVIPCFRRDVRICAPLIFYAT